MVRKGVWRGCQRWFCKDCQHYFSGRKPLDPRLLYEEYLTGKQTLQQLAQRHHLSVSTVQRKLRTVHSVRVISKDKDVVVLMDASYWGASFGVLAFKDAYRGKVLWRKFLTKKETIADYLEGVEWLEEHEFKIRGLVCDGLRGLAQALSRYKVQYCQFHQVKTVKKHLTSNPKTPAGIELRSISLLLCRADKESFEGALDDWYSRWGEYIKERSFDGATGKRFYTHKRVRSAYFSLKRNMRWMWTFYDFPDAYLPNTNNGIEALFTDLKSKLRVHNGLSKPARKIFIDEYCRQKVKSLSPRFGR